ncbi:hypothetical protein LINPERPRIM_LOCUS41140, partial [Linum perenne]
GSLSPQQQKISIDRRRKLLRTPPDLQSLAANSYVGPPISSAAIPIDDIWTLEIQALCPSSEAPSRKSLPEALSPYFRVSTAVVPLPSLSSFFRASNRDIFLLTAAPSVEVILREGRKELPILPYSAQSQISSSSLFCFHSLNKSNTNKQNRGKHDDDEIPTVRHHNGSKLTRQIMYDMGR